MTAFRFLHASDLHLGRRFSTWPEEIRGRLAEARHASLARLAAAARAHGARHVLVAGDVFDSETPSDPVWRQALAAMGAEADLEWRLLPGNHDSLAAEALWDRVRVRLPANVHVAMAAETVELAPGVALLTAPATRRHPGRDLTEWFDAAPDPGGIRIGLAHGGVANFGEDDPRDVIAPDRAERAGLDYLALGDWHGRVRVGPRTWYPGAPERGGFRHAGRGECLAVTIPARGALPEVAPVPVGVFAWAEEELALLPGVDAAEELERRLPPPGERRETLLRIRATGRAGLAERAALQAAAERHAPEFGFFELDDAALSLEAAPGDLDEIDRAGALRAAAEALDAQTRDEALSAAEREVARAALARLFGLLREEEA
ncbi:DNA repair exonuclease [Albimonas sp. CAU 1670]|uniref:metallophosphoesterase family protein n=1 Tax=Albimonas sp. CAU 1670 TaxID=3032599 RepID=UPI0023DBBE45|nr:DNA repair exonuclease [Albimonas sp. CAU 1670]MDF2230985.1 DNA repair exonuclease [Albimonas sp. CAU 1670]